MRIVLKWIYSLAVLFCCIGCLSSSENSGATLVSIEEMNSILKTQDAQLVDVRTPEEFQGRHIQNAQNIDFQSPTFDEDISKLDKTKSVILYCKSGGRSAKCAKKLIEAGFEKVYDLKGGISKWQHSENIRIEKNF